MAKAGSGSGGAQSKNMFDLSAVSGCPVSSDIFILGVTNEEGNSVARTISYESLQSCLSVAPNIDYPRKYGDIMYFAQGTVVSSELLLVSNIQRDLRVPLGCDGWKGTVETVASATVTFDILYKTPSVSVTATLATMVFPTSASIAQVIPDVTTPFRVPTGSKYYIKAPADPQGVRDFAATLLHSVSISGFESANPISVATLDQISTVSSRYNPSVVEFTSSLLSISATYENQTIYVNPSAGTSVSNVRVYWVGGFTGNGRTVKIVQAVSGVPISIVPSGVSGQVVNSRGNLFTTNGLWAELTLQQINSSVALATGDLV